MTKQRTEIRPVISGLIAFGVSAIAPSLAVSSPVYAIPVLEGETTPLQNNTLETAQTLEDGVTHVIGDLGLLGDPAVYDYREEGRLVGDRADTITFSDLPPGEPFFAWIDNSASNADTVLGVFDATGRLVSANDDGSPVGTGSASGISGVVNPDGTIVLGVSGFPDLTFDGQYGPEDVSVVPDGAEPVFNPPGGDYTLYIQLGATELEAATPDAADYGFPGRLDAGLVDDFILNDLPPSTPFVAWVDNSASEIDTVMGLFSPAGDLLHFDDDGSPAGTGVASAIASSVGEDGSIILKLSLFPDFNFNGRYDDDAAPIVDDQGDLLPFQTYPHGVEGDYEVFVRLGTDRLAGDVDFYTYTHLEPGQAFTAEVILANIPIRLGWFDAAGAVQQDSADSAEGAVRIVGTVPDNGTVILSVTGFNDKEYAGAHPDIGDYVLRLVAEPDHNSEF